MPIVINNFGEFRRKVAAEQKRRLSRAAIDVERHANQLLSVAGTARAGRRRVYGASRSAPGEPPRKQTGRLRASAAWELAGNDTARVGTNVKYGKFLELGTRRGLSPRPWLERALRERFSAIRAMLTAPYTSIT